MFNLTPNPFLDSICTIAVVLVALYNYYCMKTKQKGTGYVFLVVFILLYSLFYRPEIGDFWHYLVRYRGGVVLGEHWEEFYFWLAALIPNNFLLWRVAIWLPTAILIIRCFELVKVPSSYATTLFLIFGLATYYYTRNALASSVLYIGMALFCLRDGFERKRLMFFVSIALCLGSWFLHKSMPMYIGIAFLSLLLPFKKNVIIGSLIAFPILYGILIAIGSDLLQISELWIQEGVGESYLNDENTMSTGNWIWRIGLIISYAPVFYYFFIAFYKPIPIHVSDFSYYKSFFYFSFFVVFLSFLFWGQGSIALHGRLYKTAMIPFVFNVAQYYKYHWGSKQCTYFEYLVLIKIAWVVLTDII